MHLKFCFLSRRSWEKQFCVTTKCTGIKMHVQGRVQGYAGYARNPGRSLQGSPTSFVTSMLEHLGPQLCRHYPTEALEATQG
jgi:hypothetical protein